MTATSWIARAASILARAQGPKTWVAQSRNSAIIAFGAKLQSLISAYYPFSSAINYILYYSNVFTSHFKSYFTSVSVQKVSEQVFFLSPAIVAKSRSIDHIWKWGFWVIVGGASSLQIYIKVGRSPGKRQTIPDAP